jgi:Na+/H+-dicarboxylate symporter
MLKITHEINFIILLPIFGNIICLVTLVQVIYIGFLFFIVCGGNWVYMRSAIKNSLSAGMVGFSSMSSIVTMPVTLKAAEKNTTNSEVTRITISTTVNCHDIGGCISLPMIALTIIYINSLTFPDFTTYIWFAILAAFFQFSSVSVPGGSVAIILPLLTKNLGFNNEMVSLLIALAICLDPIETANNVMGNSVFAIFIDKIFNKVKRISNITIENA